MTVGTDRAATTTDTTATNDTAVDTTNNNTTTDTEQLRIEQRHVNVVRLVLDVVLQETVVLPS